MNVDGPVMAFGKPSPTFGIFGFFRANIARHVGELCWAGKGDDRDRAVAEYLAGHMSMDVDDYNARVAADHIESPYLDEKLNLAIRD